MTNLEATVNEAYRWFVFQPVHQLLPFVAVSREQTQERTRADLDVSRDFNALGVARDNLDRTAARRHIQYKWAID